MCTFTHSSFLFKDSGMNSIHISIPDDRGIVTNLVFQGSVVDDSAFHC